jgi:hypothetical protein
MSAKKRPILREGHTFWLCPKCEQEKLPEEFHKCRSTSTGLYNYCKKCQNAIVMERYNRLAIEESKK